MFYSVNNGNLIQAPSQLFYGGKVYDNPTDEQYKQAGFLPLVVANKPQDYPWCTWERVYTTTDEHIVESWQSVDRDYKVSKYAICEVATEAEKLNELVEYVNSNATLKFLWDACTVLDTSDVNFNTYVVNIQSALSLSDEEMENFLHSAAMRTNQGV